MSWGREGDNYRAHQVIALLFLYNVDAHIALADDDENDNDATDNTDGYDTYGPEPR